MARAKPSKGYGTYCPASLAAEIVGARNRVAVERGRYNAAVGALNERLDQFPWRLVRGSLAPREYFEAPRALADPALELGS